MKFYTLLLVLLIVSCKENIVVEGLKLYNGVSEITVNNDNIYFLSNLSEYNNIMALCSINYSGKLLFVHPIDKYSNVDVTLPFMKLNRKNGIINLIYDNRGKEVIIESFLNNKFLSKKSYYKSLDSFGSIIKFPDSNSFDFIKHNMPLLETNTKGYKINYITLNNDFEMIKNKEIDLGQYYPKGILALEDKIFYYTDERTLSYKQINSDQIITVYNFQSDIIQLKHYKENLLVLLSDSIYIVTSDGQITKGFNLINENSNYTVQYIIDSNDDNIIVQLYDGKETKIKLFNYFGSQINEFSFEQIIVGSSMLLDDGDSTILIYSDLSNLYLNNF